MIRVVIDTNVIVSAALVDEGLPAAVLDLAASKHILMVVSAEILAEYEDVLTRPRFKLAAARVRKFLTTVRKMSELVRPSQVLAVSRDESDNRFYECAEMGNADYLITGNVRHFPVHHKGTKVVTPRQFVELVGASLANRDQERKR